MQFFVRTLVFAFAIGLICFCEQANAQHICRIPVAGASWNQPTAQDAVDESEASYFDAAIAIIQQQANPLCRYLGTTPPVTTVYPNPDGTFSAFSTGFVIFDCVFGCPDDNIDDNGNIR